MIVIKVCRNYTPCMLFHRVYKLHSTVCGSMVRSGLNGFFNYIHSTVCGMYAMKGPFELLRTMLS